MTDDDKALVERLRKEDEWTNQKPYFHAHTKCLEAADRIEAQAAEIERLKGAWEDDTQRYVDNTESLYDEIERLREAGNDLGFYAGHEDACDCVKGWAKGPCNCGYTEAWQAWHSLAGKAEQ